MFVQHSVQVLLFNLNNANSFIKFIPFPLFRCSVVSFLYGCGNAIGIVYAADAWKQIASSKLEHTTSWE